LSYLSTLISPVSSQLFATFGARQLVTDHLKEDGAAGKTKNLRPQTKPMKQSPFGR